MYLHHMPDMHSVQVVFELSHVHNQCIVYDQSRPDIYLLDNHYKVEDGPNPDMIKSYKMIMETYGGPEGIMKSLYTDPKVSNHSLSNYF